jgi:hypothetical protein
LAETEPNPLKRRLPDGIVPEDEVTRTEDRWIVIVLGMLGVMMAVIVVTGVTNGGYCVVGARLKKRSAETWFGQSLRAFSSWRPVRLVFHFSSLSTSANSEFAFCFFFGIELFERSQHEIFHVGLRRGTSRIFKHTPLLFQGEIVGIAK